MKIAARTEQEEMASSPLHLVTLILVASAFQCIQGRGMGSLVSSDDEPSEGRSWFPRSMSRLGQRGSFLAPANNLLMANKAKFENSDRMIMAPRMGKRFSRIGVSASSVRGKRFSISEEDKDELYHIVEQALQRLLEDTGEKIQNVSELKDLTEK